MKAAFHIGEAGHHRVAAAAMRAGLERHGIAIVDRDADFCIAWGWRLAKPLRQAGQNVLVMERGYIGGIAERRRWTSLGWNGLNGRAAVPPVNDSGARWRKHFDGRLAPWADRGEAVYVMGQVPGDAALDGIDIDRWYCQAVAAARRFGLPVRFRPHPVALERHARMPRLDCDTVNGALADTLARARCVMTFNSNSGVDAALAGVPVIACDAGSMAWPIAGHGLAADPPRPDRTQWSHALAWRQWLIEEIARGDAWDYLREYKP